MLALLHTSPIHIARFNAILKTLNYTGTVKHYVNETILRNALAWGKTDSEGFCLEIERIKLDKPHLIICTCSTFGAECDLQNGVERIDRPIAEYLVEKHKTIGLAYTATSTKESSLDLLRKSAKKLGKTIDVIDCNCTDCWKHLEKGDQINYEKGIASNVSKIESEVDAVFLAQASMEKSKNHLNNFTKEVVTSPEYGIQQLIKHIPQPKN